MGEQLTPVLGHEHVVFDADATEAGQIGTGFDGEDHVWGECDWRQIRSRLADARLFVHLEAETVAGAMTEGIAEAAAAQHLTRCRIHRRCVDAGLHRGDGRGLRVPDCIVYAPRLARGRTNRYGAV